MAMMQYARFALAAFALVACAPLVGADLDGYELAPNGTPTSEPAPAEATPGEQGSSGSPNSNPNSPTPDGGADASPAKKCEGKALACNAFAKDTECKTQQGCTWVPPACSGQATGCATFDPNVCYARQPACTFDFDTRECLPAPSWCKTTDAATCGARAGCSWKGGCTGTATTCAGLIGGACGAQRGCALVD
jgi:hypothetical protein